MVPVEDTEYLEFLNCFLIFPFSPLPTYHQFTIRSCQSHSCIAKPGFPLPSVIIILAFPTRHSPSFITRQAEIQRGRWLRRWWRSSPAPLRKNSRKNPQLPDSWDRVSLVNPSSSIATDSPQGPLVSPNSPYSTPSTPSRSD